MTAPHDPTLTAGEERLVTHGQAPAFLPDAVATDLPANPPRRGPAKTGEFFPGSRLRPINHGTIGGYRTHHRRGEQMCEPCRDAERRRLGYAAPQRHAQCGTNSGYARHVRTGTPPCRACKDAHNTWQRAYIRRTGRVAPDTPIRRKPTLRTGDPS